MFIEKMSKFCLATFVSFYLNIYFFYDGFLVFKSPIVIMGEVATIIHVDVS